MSVRAIDGYSPTARSRGRGPGCGRTPRAARPDRPGRLDRVDLADVQLQAAALAAALADRRGADAAVRLADPLVQRQQIVGDGAGGGGTLGGELGDLGV